MNHENNLSIWNDYYKNIRRQRHCDLLFLTLLYRSAGLVLSKIDGQSALVIGAGDGAEAFELCRIGYNVLATDISENAISRIEQFNQKEEHFSNLKTKVIDQRELKNINKKFNIVISWSTLSYLPYNELQAVVDSISVLLKDENSCAILLFEDKRSNLYLQQGAENTSNNRYKLPNTSKVNPGLEMTFLNELEIREILFSNFTVLASTYREVHLPPSHELIISQSIYVVRRKM